MGDDNRLKNTQGRSPTDNRVYNLNETFLEFVLPYLYIKKLIHFHKLNLLCMPVLILLIGTASIPARLAHAQSSLETIQSGTTQALENKTHFKALAEAVSLPIKTEQIDRAGEELGVTLGKIGDKISSITGSWINKEPISGISWLKFLVSFFLFLLLVVFERLLRLALDRWLRQNQANALHWRTIFIRGIRKPLSLFIYSYGSYAALSPLFSHATGQVFSNTIYNYMKWCTDLLGTISALWFIYRMFHLADYRINQWAKSQNNTLGRYVITLSKRYKSPIKLFVILVFLKLVIPLIGFSQSIQVALGQFLGIILIAAITWLIVQSISAIEDFLLSRYRIDVADNLIARKIHTQIRFLKRLAITIILVLAFGSTLMVFDKVRQFGTSILASAGIVGIVVGLAAQRSISNILVGLQIALTQPIRIDDVVIVEKEWGRIEEITTTYVVVKLWDLRRLIVPTTYFTEKPFQNWTRVSTELLGTVFLYTDYTVPVDVVRNELEQILRGSKLWNGKVGEVQVTECTNHGMELRLLVSAADASIGWDLRCEVREKMIKFLQQNYPTSLPKIRAELREVVT